MNFLLDNPIASMDGTAFLVLFIVFIVSTLAVLAVAKATIDATDKMPIPAIPPQVDPFEIAYLRGGANELARSVVFSLVQKGFLHVANSEKTSHVRLREDAGDTARLPEIERIALSWIGPEKEAKDVFDASSGLVHKMEEHSARYQIELSNRQFLMPDEWSSRAKKYGIAAAIAIAGFGGFKVMTAIMVGRFNIIFTVVLTVIAVVIAMTVGRMPRVTKLGNQYLQRLQSAFDDLKYRSQAPYIGSAAQRPALAEGGQAGIDPLLLSVGVFGTGILAGTIFSNYNDTFARQHQAGSSCGSACGSGCSSSCGSSDGGGSSCGGGCGGCS